ncbi:Uncharacterized membrane protein YphA, DoxX/SURF4 family [Raineyella antarctica]|uniref:Uncharacterized membrane protein YphA, DoxX/SURF4 family n=1 Tax=Raineyella antarctica TaxID=1577474 RepID=A0A1G6GD23_9ACTN|nr:DoxX family protein [Raineyella antarctica]SDB79891.1 Uncharacterized membrane protein YphA, DoxX/SURF4 family [Raineyella antarctica]
MTPRDHDDDRSDDQAVDRPEGAGVDDEAAEPTVTRLSRADVRRYEETMARSSGEDRHHPAQPAPEDTTDDWHDVTQPGGEPRSEATPPRDRAAGPAATAGRDEADAAGAGSPAPLAAGAPDDQPTQTLGSRDRADDQPTVVTRGPLVGDRRGHSRTDRPTKVLGGPAAGASAAGATAAVAAGTGPAPAPTGILPVEDEDAALRAERRAERDARDRALGKRRPQPAPPVAAEPPSTRLPRTTDRPAASLGLFVLRLAVAAVVGVRGAQQLMDIPGTINTFTQTALPYPEIFAWGTAVASVLIGVALVLGLLVRVAGLGTALVGIGALVYVYWWRSPFESGLTGFRGETELLLAAVGLFFLLVGGGAWGIDGAVRKGRLQRRAERFEAEQI